MTDAARPGDAATDGTGSTAPRRVLFVTGRLAEPALRRVLAEMAPPFAYDVSVLRITVAALMTTAVDRAQRSRCRRAPTSC